MSEGNGEAKVKKRRRRKSYPIKLRYDGKLYRGYSYTLDGAWLILDVGGFDADSGRQSRMWFALDKVNTFSIDESHPVQPRQQEWRSMPVDIVVDRSPRVIQDLQPFINVDPNVEAQRFKERQKRDLELAMGPDAG